VRDRPYVGVELDKDFRLRGVIVLVDQRRCVVDLSRFGMKFKHRVFDIITEHD
jgi:hypothetical protein